MASSDEVLEANVSSDNIGVQETAAFKPPTRPGASLRARNSAARLLDSTNAEASSSTANEGLASSSSTPKHATSPSSTERSDLAAAIQAQRTRLDNLGRQNETQTTAVGALGHDLLQQQRVIESLKDELRNARRQLESSDENDGQLGEQVKALMERIDAETSEMVAKSEQSRSAVINAGREDLPGLPTSASASNVASPSTTYAFLANDPTTMRSSQSHSAGFGVQGITPSRSSDRRARNAAAPSSIHDKDLVNQLQEGLVNEVRRLQALLLQREQQMKAHEETAKKADEELGLWRPKAMSLMEQEDALKQENWDLQVRGQQIEEQLEEERAAVRKLESERTRVTRELAKVRETADERKAQIEGQTAELEALKSTRETEVALARKDKASYLREQGDLQAELQKYKAEALRLERANMSHSGSRGMLSIDNTLAGDESTDSVMPPVLARGGGKAGAQNAGDFSEDTEEHTGMANTARDREVTDLRGKLALAQKKTGKDSAEKRKLREQVETLRRLLNKAGLDAPAWSDVESSDDDAAEEAWVDIASSARTKGKGGRIPKSSTRPNIASRFGLTPSLSAQTVSEAGEESYEDASGSGFEDDESVDNDEGGGAGPARKKDRRRSTIRAINRLSTNSPLSTNVSLPGDEDDESVEEPVKRLPTSRRSAGAGQRVVSDVVPAAALGDELDELNELNDFNDAANESTASLPAPEVSLAPQMARELSEEGVQTEDLPDLVTPALAAQQAQHEETLLALQQTLQAQHEQALSALERDHQARHEDVVASLQAAHQSRHDEAMTDVRDRHKVHMESLSREHEEAVAALTLQHKSRLDELAAAHAQALHARDDKAAEYVTQLEQGHEASLSEKMASHAAALAAALASQKEQHEGAMAEARSRHTQVLADHVANHTSALGEAEAKHRAALAEREKLYKSETEKRDDVHQQELAQRERRYKRALEEALEEKEREHQDMIEDIHSTNDSYLSQRDAAYGAALKERDEQVIKARAELQRLRAELETLTAELAEARRLLAAALAGSETYARDLEQARDAHTAASAAAAAQLEALRQQHLTEQAQLRESQVPSMVELADTKRQLEAALADSEKNVRESEEARTKHTSALAAAAAELEALRQQHLTELAQLRESQVPSIVELADTKRQLAAALSDSEKNVRGLQEARDGHTAALATAATQLEALRQQHLTETNQLRDLQGSAAAELAEARRMLAAALADSEKNARNLAEARDAHTAALAAAASELEALRQQHLAEEMQRREVQAQTEALATDGAWSQPPSMDGHDHFSDAVDDRFEAASARSGDVTPQPVVEVQNEPEFGVRRVILADLREFGIQTDDENWARIQQEQLMLRPSAIDVARPGKTAVGAGGLTVLGGYAPQSGASDRGAEVQPAPALYSVDDVNAALQRRSASDPAATRPDTSKPPVLAVPPPPSGPPPTSQESGAEVSAPMRPTSPPPPKLIARASLGNNRSLIVPGSPGEPSRPSSRMSNAGGPPSSYRRPESRMTMADDGRSVDSNTAGYLLNRPQKYRRPSGTSMGSDATSLMSSQTSLNDYQSSNAHEHPGDETLTGRPRPSRRSGRASNMVPDTDATDPVIIQAITQTMIGEYLYKYTRRAVRGGLSDNRHRRYFWVHPYTKMIYWTATDPGGDKATEGVSKAACIQDVSVVEDPNTSPPGLYHLSLIIKTSARDIKVTAENKERHDVWLNALGYLVNRGDMDSAAADTTVVAETAATPSITGTRRRGSLSRLLASPGRSLSTLGRLKSTDSLSQQQDNDATPKGRSAAEGSVAGSYRSKRRDTAAREYLQQQSRGGPANDFGVDGRRSRNSSAGGRTGALDPVTGERLKTAEEMLEENEREGFEGLDNVRACCGGAHDVGALAHKQYQQRKTHRRPGSSLGVAGAAGPHTPRHSNFSMSGPGTSRPSSRLSNVSNRPRGSSSSTHSTNQAMRERDTSSPPPQLGPLNLNTPRAKGGAQKGDTHNKTGETFASLFDLPAPTPANRRASEAAGEETLTPKTAGPRSVRVTDQYGSVRSTR
ncbi:hypothetical protein BCV69DRAFT_280980 [Microstroma glucosiphilum]|uniref:PH domain-containing protein n=1 Tax=Pseudomicrostroma glucosiphilum TaxID=1684307 RepID=A0A316UDU5_9BASI|nr:hypothetical protein BCV69DRAFT_280980 [Pseudomicrostroma glucosiphilum]PWN23370.1 hypothetical protein BCV69DRAFT_280980 [Pseudomicrostroma glucosiphilum]